MRSNGNVERCVTERQRRAEKGPPPSAVEIRRRQLMTHDRQLYEYIEALVVARELERAGGDAGGALDNYGAANRVWALAGRWRARRDALRAEK